MFFIKILNTNGRHASIPIHKLTNKLKTLLITPEKKSSLSTSLICNDADSCQDKLNILNILDNIFENLAY